jgi:hypothetical protein
MFTQFPESSQILLRISLAAAWAFSAAAGLSAVVFLPDTNGPDFMYEARVLAGITLAVATTAAGIGVALNKYRIEWVCSWLAAAGFTPFIALYWTVVYKDTDGTLPIALMMSSLVTFYAFRGISCAAHATRLRRLHDDTGPIKQLEEDS